MATVRDISIQFYKNVIKFNKIVTLALWTRGWHKKREEGWSTLYP